MLRAIVDGLARGRLPPRVGDDDPIAAAWAASADVPAMVDFLGRGAEYGIYELDGWRRQTEREDLTKERWAEHSRWIFRLRLPDERYVRVDFTGGAAELRAIVPTVEPYETWVRAIEQVRARIIDPMVLLVWDIDRLGAPDPRWAARSTLEEAWRGCASSTAMRRLLVLAGRGDLEAQVVQEMAARSAPAKPTVMECLDDERRWGAFELELERWRMAIVREVVPQLPQLTLPTEPHGESPRAGADIPR